MPQALRIVLLSALLGICSNAIGTPGAATTASDSRARAYALYLQAQDLAGEGNALEARQKLEEVLNIDPEANAVRARLARVCLVSGDLSCAENEALRALVVSPDEIEAHKVLAEISLGRFQESRDPAVLGTALEHLKQAARIEPRDPWPWAIRVQVLGLEGRFVEAEAVAAEAAATPGLDPSTPWMALARVLLGQGRQQEAVALLDRVHLTGRAAVPLLELVADLKAGMGDLEGLADALTRLRRLRPEDADVARRLGRVLSDLGDYYGAIEPLRGAHAIRPGDPLTRRDLAGVLVRLGRGEETIALLEGLAEGYRSPHIFLIWARAAEQAKQPALAAEKLQTLIGRLGEEDQRSFAPALLRRAAGNWLDAGQPSQALNLMSSFGDDPDAWRTRLQARIALGQEEAARKSLHDLLATAGEDPALAATLIEHLLTTQGESPAMEMVRDLAPRHLKDLRATVIAAATLAGWGRSAFAARMVDQLDPSGEASPELIRAQAAVYYGAQRYDRAEELYRQALAANPDDDSSLNDLGYLLATRGGPLEKALELCERAVALRPDQPAYLDSLGWVLHLSGRSDEGLEYLRRAVTSASDDALAEIHEHLGDVYAALGQRERALAEWEAARALGEGREGPLLEKIQRMEQTREGEPDS